MQANRIIDIWQMWRGPIIEGLQSTFDEEGNAEMVEKMREWKEDSENYLHARVLATRHIVKAMETKVQQQPSLRNAFLEEALTHAPDLPFALVMAGKFALQDQDADKAEELLRPVLEQPWSDTYYDAVMGLAKAKEDQKRLDEAIAYTELAEEKNPYFPNAFSFRAYLLHRMGKTDEALEALRQGLFYNPDDPLLVKRRREIVGAGS
jgi:tetratricopeptide (TPR) repeat protein